MRLSYRLVEIYFAPISVRSYRLQLHQPDSERSTPTILEDQEAEDFEEAEYRQLQREGYNFHRHLVEDNDIMSSTTATTTQDLDQLLEELRRTSLDYSSSPRSPASYNFTNGTHSSRAYSNQRSTFMDPVGGSAGRYSNRSYSFTGKGGNRQGGRWVNTSSSTATSYQRSQAYSTDRGTSGIRGGLGGDNEGFVRHATPAPAPKIPSSQQQRYQTTFRTTLQHRPPVSPKRFNQINVTIDPEFGTASVGINDNYSG